MKRERKVHCKSCGKWLFEVDHEDVQGRVRHGVHRVPLHDNPPAANGGTPLLPDHRSAHVAYHFVCTCGNRSVHNVG